MLPQVAEQRVSPHTIGRSLERLRADYGFRVLQRAKAHLWTDWLTYGSENEDAIEFLSEFILCYAQMEGIASRGDA